jgi:hypothetical protein
MLLNNPFTTLKDFFYIITGQTNKIVGPFGSLEVTEPIGGEAATGNKIPWYVIPVLVIVIAIILIKVGTAAGNKLVEKI